MIFKQNWEKGGARVRLLSGVIEKIVRWAFHEEALIEYQVIFEGCVNCNIKVKVEGNEQPLIVRIYLRDQAATYREKALGVLLNPPVPVPLTYKVGNYKDYRFAITQCLPGVTLSELLLSGRVHDVGAIMYEAGLMLAKIAGYPFSKAGFFDQNLHVIESTPREDYLKFAQKCFKSKTVATELGSEMIAKIHECFDKNTDFFPNEDEHHLVHGDFDPANILVDRVDGEWKITGILDWEFAFSGSILWDVANMLRYAHQMPFVFEEAFLRGLKSGGISLENGWRRSMYLLNILSLLDCLARARSKSHPKQCADICRLISFFLSELEMK